MLQGLLGVEVGDTLTAHGASEDILMSVNESVDASFTELVDQSLNFVEIGIVVGTLGALDGLPHDTEADEVLAPLDQASNVFVVEGVLGIKLSIGRNVRVNLVDDVDTMEDDLSASLIDESAVCRVDVDSLGSRVDLNGFKEGELGVVGGEFLVSEDRIGKNSGTEAGNFQGHV